MIAGTSPSKREALRMAREAEAQVMAGMWADPRRGKVSFAEYFLNQWLPNRQIEPGTRDTYLTHFRTQIEPVFGHKQMRDITPTMVQEWITSMVRAGLRPGTVRAKYAVLASTFDAQVGSSAVRDGLVDKSPCRKIQLPSMVARDVTIYSPEEVERLLEAFDPWWRPMPFVDSETGLRWGELIALRPCDVVDRYISVNHTIVERRKGSTSSGTRFDVKVGTKSGKTRKVAITPEMLSYLRRLAWDRGVGQEDLFFAMPDPSSGNLAPLRTVDWPHGLPVSRSHFRDVWLRTIEKAGVPRRRFHDLRATHISWLLAGGADVPSVMRRSGHSQIPTLQRYTQAMEDHDMRALNALRRTKEGSSKKAKKSKKARKSAGIDGTF
ncbi:integrase [Marmoricola sp. URHA0025 HA25]